MNRPLARPSRIFAQFLNPEITSLYGVRARYSGAALIKAVMPLTRLGLLFGEAGLVVPHTYMSEVREFDAWLSQIEPAATAGLLHVASASPSGLDLVVKKRREYRDELELFPDYKDEVPPELGELPWAPRNQRSSSDDIAQTWRLELGDDGIWQAIIAGGARPGTHRRVLRLEDALYSVPGLLDGHAFVMRYIRQLLPVELDTAADSRVAMMISRAYLESYLDELDACVLSETHLGSLDCGLARSEPDRVIHARRLAELLRAIGIDRRILVTLPIASLVRLRAEPVWGWYAEQACADVRQDHRPLLGAALATATPFDALSSRGKAYESVRDRLLEFRDVVEEGGLPIQLQLSRQTDVQTAPARASRGSLRSIQMPGQRTLESNDVFLVCGRDNRAVSALRQMLSAADIHLIEWDDARRLTHQPSPYVLDVIKAAFDNVDVILVLLTPEEEATLLDDYRGTDDRADALGGVQPRPNVLVELGMALAVAGQDKTVIVEMGRTRSMTDLEGVHTLRFENTAGKRQELINRLTDAGIEARGSRYLEDGDFSFLDQPTSP